MTDFQVTVPFVDSGKRIDSFLVGVLNQKFSRQEIKVFFKTSQVFVNEKLVKPRYIIKEGDRVRGKVETQPVVHLKPESIDVKVLYEDESLLVIDKPAGMVVHPGAGNRSGTLVHALLGRNVSLSTIGGGERPGIVHRLDKETSGLLVVAKTNAAHRKLQSQFAERTVSKTYMALVVGRLEFEEGTIDQPIGRHPKIRQKMAVTSLEKGREAVTRYRVLKRFRNATLLEAKLHTGRTHQIRVHFAHMGHPVVGDAVYGNESKKNRGGLPPAAEPVGSRHALHAARFEFLHPNSDKLMKFESPLPEDFKQMLRKVESG